MHNKKYKGVICKYLQLWESIKYSLRVFFLGLQFIQLEDGIFISQSKSVKEVLKKSSFDDCKLVTTPLIVRFNLRKDGESLEVEQKKYRLMIGGLLYLIASRQDIM